MLETQPEMDSKKARSKARLSLINFLLLAVGLVVVFNRRFFVEISQSPTEQPLSFDPFGPPNALLQARNFTNVELPFQGFYMCSEKAEAYGAAWLTSKEKFLRISSHTHKTAMQKHETWSVANITWGAPSNMAMGSWIVINRAKGAWRTVDGLEFAVEHLSGYSKFMFHDQKKDGNDLVTQEVVKTIGQRTETLKRGWSKGVDADKSKLPNQTDPRPLGERVLAVLPFHASSNANVFGGSNTNVGTTGQSYTLTRRAFLHPTYYSVSRIFPNIVVFVENEEDYRYCTEEAGLDFYEVHLLQDLPDNRYLPAGSVYEMERRFRRGMYPDFDYIYFSEADQILRLRPHQLSTLIEHSSSDQNNAVLSPHRYAPFPHPDDFNQRHGGKEAPLVNMLGSKPFKTKLQAIASKPVFDLNDQAAGVRCCYDVDTKCQNKQDWVPLMDEDGTKYRAAHKLGPTAPLPWSDRPSMELFRVGDGAYHFINGDPNNRAFEWRTCSIEGDLECSTVTRSKAHAARRSAGPTLSSAARARIEEKKRQAKAKAAQVNRSSLFG